MDTVISKERKAGMCPFLTSEPGHDDDKNPFRDAQKLRPAKVNNVPTTAKKATS